MPSTWPLNSFRMGVGHQRNEQSNRDLELSLQPPGSLGRRAKKQMELITSDLINLAYKVKPPLNNLKGWSLGASRLVDTFEVQNRWHPQGRHGKLCSYHQSFTFTSAFVPFGCF